MERLQFDRKLYGIVTTKPKELEIPGLELKMLEVKDVLGRRQEPLPGTVSMISCFADNKAVKADPELAAVSRDGMKATRKEKYFDWDCICPSRDEWKREMLDLIRDAAGFGPVRIDDIGFPREGFCWCPVCQDRFAQSQISDWEEWRASVITEFVRDCREAVSQPLYMTLYPDPLKSHLKRRFGVDVDAISPYIDCFVIPLYDIHYGVTYWIESIAWAFQEMTDKPTLIELYVGGVETRRLVKAAEVARHYSQGILFAYPRNAEEVTAALTLLKDTDAK